MNPIIPTGIARNLRTSKGREVTTSFTDREAFLVCENLSNSFAKDLFNKWNHGRVSEQQIIWAHILAVESIAPVTQKPGIDLGNFGKIISIFNHAKDHNIKFPKIRLVARGAGDSETHILLKLAKVGGKNEGFIYVINSGNQDYYGKISPEGKLFKSKSNDLAPEIITSLQEFAQDPAKAAKIYGLLTNNCSFCNKELTDARSVAMGYGPICSEKFGLPWGDERAKASLPIIDIPF